MQAILLKQAVDLVILDIMMPGKDGLTLCRQMRAHSNIPIFMLTAISEEVDRILGLEIGTDDYLSKPFNPRNYWRGLGRFCGVARGWLPERDGCKWAGHL